MRCHKCNGETRVIDSVHTADNENYRKRKCLKCGHIFYTCEYMVYANQEFMDEWHAAHRKKMWLLNRTEAAKLKALERKKQREASINHARWEVSRDPDNICALGYAKCSECGYTTKIGREPLPHMCPECKSIMDKKE